MLGRPLNPVLARELRQRMRGPRAAVIITLYLLVLSGILQIMYSAVSRTNAGGSGPGAEQLAGLGKSAFQTLVFFVLLLVCFIVPGLTAGAVAGERERQTLVPLQVTLLGPRSIVVGKMLASLAFVVLLVVATLPLVGVSFLLGGVEPADVVKAAASVLAVAVVLAALSLGCSTLLRRTQGATVVAYGLVLFLVVGTFFVFGAQMLVSGRGPQGRSQLILSLNPFMATASALEGGREGLDRGRGASPFTPLQLLIDQRKERPRSNPFDSGAEAGQAEAFIGPDGEMRPMPIPPVQPDRPFDPPLLNRVPFWVLSLAAYAGLVLASVTLASRRLALPKATMA